MSEVPLYPRSVVCLYSRVTTAHIGGFEEGACAASIGAVGKVGHPDVVTREI